MNQRLARVRHFRFIIGCISALLALALVGWVLLGITPAAGSGNTISQPDGGSETSLVLNSSANPVVSYHQSNSLKLLRCGNAACTSGNTFAIPDAVGVEQGLGSSLALDSSGKAVISYTGFGVFGQSSLKILHCVNVTCASGSNYMAVPDAGAFSSLALDANGYPVVSYYSSGMLKVLHCGDANCLSGNSIVSIESAGPYGSNTSLTLDSSGRPVVAYTDTADNLRVLHCGNADCSSDNITSSPASVGSLGGYLSLVLDGPGFPVVTFYNNSEDALKLLRCGDVNCSLGNVLSVLDSDAWPDRASLALDAAGYPVVAYYKPSLRVLHRGNPNCTSGNALSAPDSELSVGRYNSMALDALGRPVVSYMGIKVLHCGDANCGAAVKPTVTPTFTPTPAEPTPTPCDPCPVNFTLSADVTNDGVDDCNTYSGPTACTLPAGDSFRVRLNFTSHPPGAGYDGWDAQLMWSGALTYIVGTLRHTATGSGTEVLIGSTVSTGAASAPPLGPLFSSRLFCSQGQNNTISIVHSETDVVNGGVHHESPPGPDTLTIRCPRTDYSQPMTVAGGGVLNTDQGDSLTVAPNSIASDTKVTLNIGVPTDPAPGGLVALLRTYDFQPSLAFSTDATAVFSYAGLDLGLADPNSLKVYGLNELTSTWELVGGVVNTENETVTVSLSHFSTYALLRDGTVDTDNDGCPDGREVATNQLTGGLRDWNNEWDYFNPSGDGINRVDDILLVVNAYFEDDNDSTPGQPPYVLGYNPDTDRVLPPSAPHPWSLQGGNGLQRVDDILNAVKQYFHDCS